MADNSEQEETEAPRGALTLRTMAMPADTNANGDIFGGWVLAQMDLAAGIAGGERARGRVATVAVDAMSFLKPVRVGDVLCVYAEIAREGRSSVAIHLEAWALKRDTQARQKVTDGVFTMVAIDDQGRSRPLP